MRGMSTVGDAVVDDDSAAQLKLDGGTGEDDWDGGYRDDCTGCGGAGWLCLVVSLGTKTVGSNWTDSICGVREKEKVVLDEKLMRL